MTDERYEECAAAEAEMEHLRQIAAKWEGVSNTLFRLYQVAFKDPQAGEQLRAWLKETWNETCDQWTEASARAGLMPYTNTEPNASEEYQLCPNSAPKNLTQPTTQTQTNTGEKIRVTSDGVHHTLSLTAIKSYKRNRPQSAG